LEVGNWVGLIVATNSPKLGAATGQESAKVISINKDACRYRQFHHLLRGVGTVELTLHIRVTIDLMAEVIQGIQQGLGVRVVGLE
jgi:hypothetical protein